MIIWLLQQPIFQNVHGKGLLGVFFQLHECICAAQTLQEPHSLDSSLIPQRLMRFIRGKGVSASAFMSNATIAQKHTN